MKFLKKLALIILVMFLLAALTSVFLPGHIHVKRTIAIKAPAEIVFNQVNDLRNWKNWSYWDQIDPGMVSTYEGPVTGAGSVHKWSSNHEHVRNGSLTIIESTPHTSIRTALNVGEMNAPGGVDFLQGKDGVQVDYYMDMDLPFYGRIFPGLVLDSWLGADFDKTLTGLKNYSEKLSVNAPGKWHVEIIEKPAMTVLQTSVTCPGSEFKQKLENSFTLLMDEIIKQGLTPAGPQFAIYNQWSPDTVMMVPGIPVNKPAKSGDDLVSMSIPATKMIRVDYFGANSEQAHFFMDQWATENKVVITGPPMEEYIVSANGEGDSTKWHTRIYYPVQ